MKKISIVYSSGSGHTRKLAEYIQEGIKQVKNTTTLLIDVNHEKGIEWDKLHNSDAIVFGSPAYMGSVTAAFKEFMDATSSFWLERSWKDKIAAGFTIGNSPSGDNLNVLTSLSLFAAQHGMIWVSQEELGSLYTGDGQNINDAGSWLGLIATSSRDKPELIREGDRKTALLFGKRIAEITQNFFTTSGLNHYKLNLYHFK